MPNRPPLTPAQIDQFNRDGYLLVPGLLDPEETSLLLETAKADKSLLEKSRGPVDSSGRTSKLSLWNHPSEDIYGMIARSNRVVGPMEQLLGGEVYHYHSKMMLKEPRVGGAWEWHQDYGYWYNNGCLFPYLASCMIAVDRANRANGCLEVLKGSHLMGRIDHGSVAGQVGANVERVKMAMERLELVHCEMEPGTGLFFHCNTLHSSGPNTSDNSRWVLICCYNAARNDPYKDGHHPRYTPLVKVDDSAIMEVGAKGMKERKASLKADAEQAADPVKT